MSLPPWVLRDALAPDLDPVLRFWDLLGTPRGVSDNLHGLTGLLALDPRSLLNLRDGR
jgi:hypothetical protein